MKRMVTCLFAILLAACLLAACAEKKQPLRGLTNAKNMIDQLSWGNIIDAWDPVYRDKADPDLEEKLEACQALIGGREVLRCDCYEYTTTGDAAGPGNYEEITRYKITLEDNTLLYAQAVCFKDENGEGIISLEVFENDPWGLGDS